MNQSLFNGMSCQNFLLVAVAPNAKWELLLGQTLPGPGGVFR